MSLIPKRGKVFFWIFFLSGLFLAAAAYSEKAARVLYFFWRQPFLGFIRVFCVSLICFLILRRFNQKVLRSRWLKLIGGIIFLPVLLLPVFRCYFKVPYVFCRACPNRCPWGLSRTFFFGAFVALNLSGKFWCTAICPFGTFQESQARMSKKPLNPPPRITALSCIMLLLALALYFLTLIRLPWIGFFETGKYTWTAPTAVITALVVAAAFFIPRFWCRYLCPIGALAELTSKLQHPKRSKK